MPMCMWASTQPGNARRFPASNAALAWLAGRSGARRSILPSLIATSRQSTDCLLGRTTRAFLITRSYGLSIVRRRRLFRGFVALAEFDHLWRADQLIEGSEVEHAGAERLVRSMGRERAVELARHVAERPHDSARKDHQRK